MRTGITKHIFSLVILLLGILCSFNLKGQTEVEIKKVKAVSTALGQSKVKLEIENKNVQFFVDHSKSISGESLSTDQILELINKGEIRVLQPFSLKKVDSDTAVNIVAKQGLPDDIFIGDIKFEKYKFYSGVDAQGRELFSEAYVIPPGDMAKVDDMQLNFDYNRYLAEATAGCKDGKERCCIKRICRCLLSCPNRN